MISRRRLTISLTGFNMQLMPEFCPVLHKQIDKLSRMASESLKEYMSEHGLRGFGYKNLSEQEIKTWDEWTNLQKMETELMDKFLKKYGEGKLDLANGTFISEKLTTQTS